MTFTELLISIAYLVSAVYCFMTGSWLLGLAGVFIPPIGVIHGVCIAIGLPWV